MTCTTKSMFNRKVDITNSIRYFLLILMIYMNCSVLLATTSLRRMEN